MIIYDYKGSDSSKNLGWLMMSWGIILPVLYIKGMISSSKLPGHPDFNQAVFHGIIEGFCGHCSVGMLRMFGVDFVKWHKGSSVLPGGWAPGRFYHRICLDCRNVIISGIF